MYLLIDAAYHSVNKTNISLYSINKMVFVNANTMSFLRNELSS